MIEFEKIYSLTIEHGYYRDGACRGLEVAPTRETTRLLDGLRLRFKRHASGFALVGEKSTLEQHRTFLSGETLRFGLLATDSDIANFTAPLIDGNGSHEAPYRFTNIAASGEVTPDLRRLPKPTNVPTRPNATGDAPFGVVEIRLAGPGRTLAHHLRFEPRQTRWVYVVPKTADTISIRDFEQDGTHKRFSIVASPAAYTSPLTFQPRTSSNFDDERFLRFYSDQLVPFHELPKRNLVLSHQPPDRSSSPLDMLLPNPTVRSIKREGEHWIAERIIQL